MTTTTPPTARERLLREADYCHKYGSAEFTIERRLADFALALEAAAEMADAARDGGVRGNAHRHAVVYDIGEAIRALAEEVRRG